MEQFVRQDEQKRIKRGKIALLKAEKSFFIIPRISICVRQLLLL